MLTGRGERRWVVLTLCAGIGMIGGCSRQMLATVFDLPPAQARAAPTPTSPVAAAVPVLPPPPFEKTLDPDSALKLLPRDRAGQVDWVAAVRHGTIRPRPVLPGRPLPAATEFEFNFDFHMQNADTSFDVAFPHSSHTALLTCNTCHPRIFQYRGAPVTMDHLAKGAFCAECHDKVAFPVDADCGRCHFRMASEDSTATPELLGSTIMPRVRPGAGGGSGNASGMVTDDFPLAQFPHWVHRSRYLCKACHMELFVPKAGANVVTMSMISDGRSCGVCHDGKTAFAADIGSCARCHTQPAKTATKR